MKRLFLVLLALSSFAGSIPCRAEGAVIPPTQQEVRSFHFERDIGNVEYGASALMRARPASIRRAPDLTGDVWYGEIARHLPGEGARGRAHAVPFIVEYANGRARRVWLDSNLDGDLTDDPSSTLYDYPPIAGARCILADISWKAETGTKEIPVDWKVRLVLEPVAPSQDAVYYRLQMVYAMTGTVSVDGRSHRAFLFDGNHDGLYTKDKDAHDGIFVDLDDDRDFEVSESSPDFGPLSKPFQMGRRIYEVDSIDAEGREMSLRETGTAEWFEPPKPGKPAPDFSYKDTTGRSVRLSDYAGRYVIVYFWGSWCGTCRKEASPLRQMYARLHPSGLEILGVSLDTDRDAMEAFRGKNGQIWPTSFTGIKGMEEPVARRYHAEGAGLLYLVDPEGRLEGRYDDVGKLEARLDQLAPRAASASH